MNGKTIVKVLKELLSKTKEKKKETKDKTLEDTNNNSALWAIITALRGPDTKDDDILKDLTTARIRGILGLENNSVVVHYEPLTDAEIVKRTALLNQRLTPLWCGDHFAEHFRNAVMGLKTLGYDVPDKELSF
jgi:hypothetical protein